MTQCERIPWQLLSRYVKTRNALSKIGKLLSPLDAGLDMQTETVRRLKENALPLLRLRKDNIEGEIQAGLLDPDQVIVSRTANLADLAKKYQAASLLLQEKPK